MTIARQALLLFSLLAFLELSFVLLLFWQLKEAESEAIKEGRAKDIFKHTLSVSREMYKGHELLSIWQAKQDSETESRLRRTFGIVLADLDFLKESAKEDREELALLIGLQSGAKALFQQVYDLLEAARNAPESKKADLIAGLAAELRGPRSAVQKLALRYVKQSQLKYYSRTSSKDLLRKNMQVIVVLGLLGNIGIALALAQFFAGNISSRLMVIISNTRKLKEGMELDDPLPGRDEIVSLDSSFHEMAAQIKEHERMRRTYVNFFREDLFRPLTLVAANICALQAGEEENLNADGRKMLGSAKSNLSRLVHIVETLTDASSLSPPEMRLNHVPTSVAKIVQKSLDSVGEFVSGYNVTIEIKTEEDYVFEADEDRIVQVLVNLLSNAAKFSKAGASVCVEATRSAGHVLFSVLDQGRGVPAEQQKLIFEKFQQVSAADGQRGTGTGLGLNLCKKIVELHGGQIGLESEFNKGSRFWFRLPVKREGGV